MLRVLSFTPLIQLHGPALLPSVLPICGVRNLLYYYPLGEMFVPGRVIKRESFGLNLCYEARIIHESVS